MQGSLRIFGGRVGVCLGASGGLLTSMELVFVCLHVVYIPSNWSSISSRDTTMRYLRRRYGQDQDAFVEYSLLSCRKGFRIKEIKANGI